MATPLIRQTSTARPFTWSREAEADFPRLNVLFTIASVLSHPDTELGFTVEVDASDSGVGVVRSQKSEWDQKLHPCAFFNFTSLSPDIHGEELRHMKLRAVGRSLGPCGVAAIVGGHRYLRSPKWLNSWHAR